MSDDRDDIENIALFERLAAELPEDDPRGPFERAGAFDAAGHEAKAVHRSTATPWPGGSSPIVAAER